MAMPGYDSLAPAKKFIGGAKRFLSDPTNYSPVAALVAGAPGAVKRLTDATAAYSSDMRDDAAPDAQSTQLASQTAGVGADPASATPPASGLADQIPNSAAPTPYHAPSPTRPAGVTGTPPVAATPTIPAGLLDPLSAAPTPTPAGTMPVSHDDGFGRKIDQTPTATTPAIPAGATQLAVGAPGETVWRGGPGGANSFGGIGANPAPAASTGPTDSHGNLIVTPTAVDGAVGAQLSDARQAAAARGDWGAVDNSYKTPADHLQERALTGNLGAQRILQNQNALAVANTTGGYGIAGKRMEIGSPLNAAQVEEAKARSSLYGTQGEEAQQKIAQQKQIENLNDIIVNPASTTQEVARAREAKSNRMTQSVQFEQMNAAKAILANLDATPEDKARATQFLSSTFSPGGTTVAPAAGSAARPVGAVSTVNGKSAKWNGSTWVPQ